MGIGFIQLVLKNFSEKIFRTTSGFIELSHSNGLRNVEGLLEKDATGDRTIP